MSLVNHQLFAAMRNHLANATDSVLGMAYALENTGDVSGSFSRQGSECRRTHNANNAALMGDVSVRYREKQYRGGNDHHDVFDDIKMICPQGNPYKF